MTSITFFCDTGAVLHDFPDHPFASPSTELHDARDVPALCYIPDGVMWLDCDGGTTMAMKKTQDKQ